MIHHNRSHKCIKMTDTQMAKYLEKEAITLCRPVKCQYCNYYISSKTDMIILDGSNDKTNAFETEKIFWNIVNRIESRELFDDHMKLHFVNKNEFKDLKTMQNSIVKYYDDCFHEIFNYYETIRNNFIEKQIQYSMRDIQKKCGTLFQNVINQLYIKQFKGIVVNEMGKYKLKCKYCDCMFPKYNCKNFLSKNKSRYKNKITIDGCDDYCTLENKFSDLIKLYLPKQDPVYRANTKVLK